MDPADIKICVLKTNVKCDGCRKKIKNQLQKVHGVHSIDIDANEGKVTIASTIDPHILMEEFAKLGKKAQLLWEQKPVLSNRTTRKEKKSNKPAQPEVAPPLDNEIDPYQRAQLAHLQELVQHRKLKQMELTHRNIKMTFWEDKDSMHDDDNDHIVKMVMDNFNGESSSSKMNVAGPSQCDNGGQSSCTSAIPSDDLAMDCGGSECYEEHANRTPVSPLHYYYAYNPQATQPPTANGPCSDIKCGASDKGCSMM